MKEKNIELVRHFGKGLVTIGLSIIALSLNAQIVGLVLEESGKTLEAVEISTHFGESIFTDTDGRFKIQADQGDSLLLKHISYKTKMIYVNSTDLQIIMHPNNYLLDQVEINSQWVYDDQAVTKTNIYKSELEIRNAGQDVPYLLRWSPSVVVTSDGGTGIGYTSLRIRGSDQERINFAINGVPLNDSESQQVFWVDLPDFASSTGQVQIQRGLGLSTNGAGAFGASVNFSTSDFSDSPRASITSGIGSFGTYRVNTQFESGRLSDHFFIKGRLSKIHSDGYIDRAEADLESFFIGAGATFGAHTFMANVFSGSEVTYQAWNGVPVNFVEDSKLRRFNSAGMERADLPHPNEVDDYDQTHAQVSHRWDINSQFSSKLTGHYTKGSGFFELYQADENLENFLLDPVSIGNTIIFNSDLIERRWLDNDFYGLIANFQWTDPFSNWRLKWGGAWNEYRGKHFGEVIWTQISNASGPDHRYYDNDALKRDWNLYTQFFYDISSQVNVFTDLQYRHVSHEFLGLDENAELLKNRERYYFFNPKMGINYTSSQYTKVYFYLGYGHKEPNRNDFVSSSPSSRPRAEKLLNAELGFSIRIGMVELNANGYWMRYYDQLVTTGQLNDVGAANRINIDNSYRLGIEWGVNTRISNTLDVNIGGTLSRNKIEDIEFFEDSYDESFGYLGQVSTNLRNVDLPFSPSVILQGQLKWKPLRKGNVIWESKYIGRQYLDNSQNKTASLSPYSFGNMTLDYHFGKSLDKGLTIRLLVQNVFNSKFESYGWTYPYRYPGELTGDYTLTDAPGSYRDIGLYPQAGINYLAGATFSF